MMRNHGTKWPWSEDTWQWWYNHSKQRSHQSLFCSQWGENSTSSLKDHQRPGLLSGAATLLHPRCDLGWECPSFIHLQQYQRLHGEGPFGHFLGQHSVVTWKVQEVRRCVMIRWCPGETGEILFCSSKRRKEYLNGETILDSAVLFNLAEGSVQGLEGEARHIFNVKREHTLAVSDNHWDCFTVQGPCVKPGTSFEKILGAPALQLNWHSKGKAAGEGL